MLHNKKHFSDFQFRNRIRICFLLLFVSLIASGCLSRKSAPARYYDLEYPAEPEVSINDTVEPLNNSCLINIVEVYPAFAGSQIAIRENSHQIRYFSFNHWAVRPEQSLIYLMTEFLNRHRVFKTLYTPSLYIESDYTIETIVYHLELVEDGNEYHSRLNLEFRLNDSQTGEEILNHRADRKHLLEERNLNLFAAAVSEIFIEELAVFAGSILTELK
ncbi:MAG: ABC-type transport auxiliary lipoprotein family protein [Bacteroidales bacterium]